MTRALGSAASALAFLLLLAPPALAVDEQAESAFTLDLYAFRQRDGGGHPLRAEALEYKAARAALTLRASEGATVRATAAVAFIDNAKEQALPESVGNAMITSASGELLTSDFSLTVDLAPEGSDWTISPGGYYHQQIDYIGTGLDLGLKRALAGGDTELRLSYSLRLDLLERNAWDGSYDGSDERISSNVYLSWTQVITPWLLGSLSAQYTRADGYLADAYNFVALYDSSGEPRTLEDERLPRYRNRGQLNGRLRLSPQTGYAIGLDASFYADDWGIEHGSVEVSYTQPLLPERLYVMAWYRFSMQSGTRWFHEQPTHPSRYQTQDPDLGDFTMHSPGTTLTIRIGQLEASEWEVRVSALAFFRDDDIDGFTARIGMGVTW